MERITTRCGTPFISDFEGQSDQPFDFFGGMAGPLGDDFDHGRREIRIGVHGHALERDDACDHHESGQHQHQEPLAQSELDNAMNHSKGLGIGIRIGLRTEIGSQP